MIDHACQMAEFGLRHGKPKEAEKEWPRMLAALLSAQKEFGIPMPPSGIGALADLRIAEQMLEQVVPLLKAGHDAEAQQVAMSFIGHLKS